MGGTASLSDYNFAAYTARSATMKAAPTAAAAFHSHLHPDMDPAKFTVRECRHSAKNPAATPIAIFGDVTGSMGEIARKLCAEGQLRVGNGVASDDLLGDDPQAFGAVGDVDSDTAPIQFGQFEVEADIMMDQIGKLYCEGNGGGNSWESYNLPWHLAAFHMDADCWKDGRKGFLFTIGDEPPPPDLNEHRLKKVYGRGQEPCMTNEQLLALIRPKFHVFHLIIEQGSHVRHNGLPAVQNPWRELLGQSAIPVSDYTKLGEIIVSLIQAASGVDPAAVAASWSDKATAMSVSRALAEVKVGAVAVSGAAAGATGLVRI